MFYLMQFCTLPRVKYLPIIFWAVERFPRKTLERTEVMERKFQKNLIFMVFYIIFSRKNAQEGPKCSKITACRSSTIFRHIFEEHKLRNKNLSNYLRIAERTGWAGNEKMGEAELERPAPLKPHSTGPWILNPDWPCRNRDWTYHW